MGYGLINSAVINGTAQGTQAEPQSFPAESWYAGQFGTPWLMRIASSVQPVAFGQPVLALRLPTQPLGAVQFGLPTTRLAFTPASMQVVQFGVAQQATKLRVASLHPVQFGLPSRPTQGQPRSFAPVRFGRPGQSLGVMVLGTDGFTPVQFGQPSLGAMGMRTRTLGRARFGRPALHRSSLC